MAFFWWFCAHPRLEYLIRAWYHGSAHPRFSVLGSGNGLASKVLRTYGCKLWVFYRCRRDNKPNNNSSSPTPALQHSNTPTLQLFCFYTNTTQLARILTPLWLWIMLIQQHTILGYWAQCICSTDFLLRNSGGLEIIIGRSRIAPSSEIFTIMAQIDLPRRALTNLPVNTSATHHSTSVAKEDSATLKRLIHEVEEPEIQFATIRPRTQFHAKGLLTPKKKTTDGTDRSAGMVNTGLVEPSLG